MRCGGISTSNLNGAAAFRRAFQTARRHFDTQFERFGGICTRNLYNGAAFRRAIYQVRRHFDTQF
jgi:hypothetical protein